MNEEAVYRHLYPSSDPNPLLKSAKFKQQIISEYLGSGGQMDLDENEGQSPNNHRSFENLLAGAKTVL